MKNVQVNLGNNSYKIHIGSNLLSELGYLLKADDFAKKVIIITNPLVNNLYGNSLQINLTKSGFTARTLLVPDGEKYKSLATATKLYKQLSDAGTERITPILALGGGVIGDLSGFVAATYLRGVPLIQLPTTLLSQVDSSIGGKVAVDHGTIKNKIGSFYQPRAVISDISSLHSLPPSEFDNGMAEVIKYAVIQDGEFFEYLDSNLDKAKKMDISIIEEIVYKSARIKAKIVKKDERDTGLRNILNFGHTAGHAIESATDFAVSHGQAVALGMLIAGKISQQLGIFDNREYGKLANLINKYGLSRNMPKINLEKFSKAIKHDKKILNGRIRFILPRSIGSVFISDEVKLSLVKQIIGEWNA